jgi:hypothetical protein
MWFITIWHKSANHMKFFSCCSCCVFLVLLIPGSSLCFYHDNVILYWNCLEESVKHNYILYLGYFIFSSFPFSYYVTQGMIYPLGTAIAEKQAYFSCIHGMPIFNGSYSLSIIYWFLVRKYMEKECDFPLISLIVLLTLKQLQSTWQPALNICSKFSQLILVLQKVYKIIFLFQNNNANAVLPINNSHPLWTNFLCLL